MWSPLKRCHMAHATSTPDFRIGIREVRSARATSSAAAGSARSTRAAMAAISQIPVDSRPSSPSGSSRAAAAATSTSAYRPARHWATDVNDASQRASGVSCSSCSARATASAGAKLNAAAAQSDDRAMIRVDGRRRSTSADNDCHSATAVPNRPLAMAACIEMASMIGRWRSPVPGRASARSPGTSDDRSLHNSDWARWRSRLGVRIASSARAPSSRWTASARRPTAISPTASRSNARRRVSSSVAARSAASATRIPSAWAPPRSRTRASEIWIGTTAGSWAGSRAMAARNHTDAARGATSATSAPAAARVWAAAGS